MEDLLVLPRSAELAEWQRFRRRIAFVISFRNPKLLRKKPEQPDLAVISCSSVKGGKSGVFIL